MVEAEGKRTNVRQKSRKLNYFYLTRTIDGKEIPLLHKSLNINRGADKIITWCYPLEQRVAYTYSDVKKNKEPAYTTQEVMKMVNRGRTTVECAIIEGKIQKPQHTYGLNEHKRKFKYMWHESNIMELHAYLLTQHRGRPRKDGVITPHLIPNARELRAMIRQEELLYVRNEDGEFVPVWRAPDFN